MTKIIQFGAKWCPACHQQTSVLKPFCEENNLEYLLLDVDVEPVLTELYEISSLPTIIIERNNEEKIKFVGFTPIREIEKLIKDL
jgi:thioredoxin 1